MERVVRDKLMEKWGGERVLTIGRCAILTRNHNGRAACHYCGPCERGCITHSYLQSLGSTLPAARTTGRLTLASPQRGAQRDVRSAAGPGHRGPGRSTARPCSRSNSGPASCFSAPRRWNRPASCSTPPPSGSPPGSATPAGQLGRNVMDHTFGARRQRHDPRDARTRPRSATAPNGIYIARFRNVKEKHPSSCGAMGSRGAGSRVGPRPRPRQGFGRDFKEALLRASAGPGDSRSGAGRSVCPEQDNVIDAAPDPQGQVGDPRPPGPVHLGSQRAGH